MSARLQSLLAPHYDLLASVMDGSALVAAVRQHMPDVIVTDIDMPGLTGLEAARQIVSEQPQARIVFVTGLHDRDVIRAALATGALGYVVKRDVGVELVPAIRACLERQIYISSTGWEALGPALRPGQNWSNSEQ
jgi:DNA-binding NarL/FixJ family response regulator